MRSFFFLTIVSLCFGQSYVELFCDYQCEAKGQEIFPLPESALEKDLTTTSLLRKKLVEYGLEIKSWEIPQYRPWFLRFRDITSFQDLLHWLGLGRPRKNPFPPSTKYWMFWNLGPKVSPYDFSIVPKEKLILVLWEPPTTQPELYAPEIQKHFGKIFTWDDDLVDHKRFFKFHYPTLKTRLKDLPPFEAKKFCTMICRRLTSRHPLELYSKRKEMIKFFEEKPEGEFDLYGHQWKGKKYKTYKGSIENKLETLKNYKFSICYENMRDVKGYVTEKIFDCFAAGVVPVYWGASNITDYVPKECFIDRRHFGSNEELYQHLKGIGPKQYQTYLDAAQKYLESQSVQVFTEKHFVNTLLPHLVEGN